MPDILQRTMDQVPHCLTCISCFYDDVVVSGKEDNEHKMRLKAILSHFSDYGIQLRVGKCKLCAPNVQYLGFMLPCQGIQMEDENAAAIYDSSAPAAVH